MGSRATNEERLLVYGRNPVRELLASDHRVLEVYVRGTVDDLARLATARGVRVHEADRQTLDRLAGPGVHHGVAAVVPGFGYASFDDIVEGPRGPLLVLDGINDPRNFGAIVRTARAAGVQGVIVPKDRAVAVTGAVVAASAGHVFGTPIARVTNISRALEALKAAGWWAVALSGEATDSIFTVDVPDPVVLVVGGEGDGVRPLVERHCDVQCSVPMAPGVESLNASVAAAIALYEIAVRRTRPRGWREI